MEKPASTAASDPAPPAAAPDAKPEQQSTEPSKNAPTPTPTPDEDPPLSKNQLKKRRRWEKSQAVKKRRKEQERDAKRFKAIRDGRDLDAERAQQILNEKEGKGWKRREEKWKEILKVADTDNSFRVCFDCAWEEEMTWKETNSLSLQLRYTYAMNRKSVMPVHIVVTGAKKGGDTRKGLEKVEGFPERWVGRAFHCFEEGLEEVYGGCIDGGGECDNAGDGKDGEKSEEKDSQAESEPTAEAAKCEEKVVKEGQTSSIETKGEDEKDSTAKTADSKTDDATNNDPDKNTLPFPKLPPNHQFVYLTGDSPNTLTTLDNNTTYIIGGIVDRNRLKRAAVERADSLNAQYPTLNIKTARLPLEENCDFKGSTRILTCNHVFEILQKYREDGYEDWRGPIMSVLPCRKDVDEKKEGGGGGGSKDVVETAATGEEEGAGASA